MAIRKKATKKASKKAASKKAARKKEPRFAPVQVETKRIYSFNWMLGRHRIQAVPGSKHIGGQAVWPCGHVERFLLTNAGAIADGLEQAIDSKVGKAISVSNAGASTMQSAPSRFEFRRYNTREIHVRGLDSSSITLVTAQRIVKALRAIQTAVDAQG